MNTIDTRTLIEQSRDASMAASDERTIRHMGSGAATGTKPVTSNAMLARDRIAMDRANAAMRRFSRTPLGRRCVR